MARRKDIIEQSVTNATLNLKLETLTDTVVKGFDGIHARQDTTNGRVGTAEKDVLLLKAREKYVHLLWFLVTALVGVTVGLSMKLIQ